MSGRKKPAVVLSENPSAKEKSKDGLPTDEELRNLTTYGVDCAEASRAVETAHAAQKRMFMGWAFGKTKSSFKERDLERLVFGAIKESEDPAKQLLEFLAKPEWASHINKDAAGFILRLHDFLESKKT